jgi:hypothetical protein
MWVLNGLISIINIQADDLQELNDTYKKWHGLLPLPIALIGLLFTTIYTYAVYKAIKQRRVSRKCYVLLMNRSIGDIFACVTALVIAIYVLNVRTVR